VAANIFFRHFVLPDYDGVVTIKVKNKKGVLNGFH